jgi:hypothetical protein
MGSRGVGVKSDDTYCIPLHPECHRLRHIIGYLSFWGNVFKTNNPDVIANLIRKAQLAYISDAIADKKVLVK